MADIKCSADQRGLGSGLFELERARQEGVRWALAWILAGPYLSMLDVMQSFLKQHRAAGQLVSAREALYRASVAGANILEAYQLTGSSREISIFRCFSWYKCI